MRIALARDRVIEGNDAFLETLNDRDVRTAITEFQDVHCEAANVDDVGDRVVLQITELGDGSRERLGIADDFVNPDAVTFPVELEIYDVTFAKEVLLEAFMKLTVVSGREPDEKCDVHGIDWIRLNFCLPQLIGNRKQRQDVETVVFSFVPKIGDALFSEGIVFTLPKDIVALKAGLGRGLDQTGGEQESGRLDALVSVVN